MSPSASAVIFGIVVGCIAGTIAISWLHYYLLPQYIVDFAQSFFNPNDVIFSFPATARLDGNKPVVALTIDDSPTDSTAEILDCLKIFNVKATFFIISSYIRGREHIMDRIIEEGHEIGNHTTKDVASWWMSPTEFQASLLECEEAIKVWREKSTDQPSPSTRGSPNGTVKWFRPGQGVLSSSMAETLRHYGYITAMASVFPNDALAFPNSRCQSNSTSLNSWYLCTRTRPGSIVVIHDRPWTVPTLQKCLDKLTNKFHLTTLTQTLRASNHIISITS